MKKNILIILNSIGLLSSILWFIDDFFSYEALISTLLLSATLIGFIITKSKFNKKNINVLFIDDEDMPVVENLKESGWSVEKINDVSRIEIPEIERSQIIFVDYKGIGKNISSKFEGLAVIKKIKDKYNNKKRVILYSAHPKFSNQIVLDPIFGSCDDQLRKNADTIEFEDMINKWMKKIK